MSMRIPSAHAARIDADHVDHVDHVVSAWARLGAGFNIEPADHTPDLERLVIDSVRVGREHARVLIVAAAWLRRHGAMVARHRLARMAVAELGDTERAILGWLLDEVGQAGPAGHAGHAGLAGLAFREVRAVCRPVPRPRPVFFVHERHPELLERVARNTTPLARRWNLLAEPFDDKPDALRAAAWILSKNPSLKVRALLEGDLRASILAAIAHDDDAGASEMELARRCGASRAAVRQALTRLEFAGQIDRRRIGRNVKISLARVA